MKRPCIPFQDPQHRGHRVVSGTEREKSLKEGSPYLVRIRGVDPAQTLPAKGKEKTRNSECIPDAKGQEGWRCRGGSPGCHCGPLGSLGCRCDTLGSLGSCSGPLGSLGSCSGPLGSLGSCSGPPPPRGPLGVCRDPLRSLGYCCGPLGPLGVAVALPPPGVLQG